MGQKIQRSFSFVFRSKPISQQQEVSKHQTLNIIGLFYSAVPRLSSSFPKTTATMIHTLMRLLRYIWNWIQQLLRQRTGPIITLDTGKRVVMGRQIAEGGFSYVFEAVAAMDDSQRDGGMTKYALKRVICPDPELIQACRNEAAVHRSCQHPNLMPLLGMSIQEHCCYMLFPYCPQSLRDVVNRRNPLLAASHQHGVAPPSHPRAPWNEVTALHLFLRICAGVQALHEEGGYSHRDIKLENVLLQQTSSASSASSSPSSSLQPVLMDFGSAGPVQRTLQSRRDVLAVVDEAAHHTTLPYRPPELFEGGARPGSVLDYRAVDVWSLACTLFALLYGASPFEVEFGHNGCTIRIVDCTHLSVLGSLPVPPSHGAIATWYSDEIRTALLEPMLVQDPGQRPTLNAVIAVVERLIQQRGGSVDRGDGTSGPYNDDNDDGDGIALMSRVV